MKKVIFTLSFLAAASHGSVLLAQAGSLDLTFDTDGKVIAPISVGGDDFGYAVAIQADGKIVVAGTSYNGTDNDFSVARFNADGSLDITFDTDGMLLTDIGGSDDFGKSIAIDPSTGDILVGGYSDNGTDNDFAVVRYNSNGTLDVTFDTDGTVTTAVGSDNDEGQALVIQADGKIVLAGEFINGVNSDVALVRYNANGTLDSGFDTDGMVTTDLAGMNDHATAVALQSDNKIVIAGYSFNGLDEDFLAIRYNTDGSADTGFDTDGIVVVDFAGYDYGYALKIQADGKIILAGYSDTGSDEDIAIARLNTNGSFDNGFDTDGWLVTDYATSDDYSQAVALDANGKILVAGYSDDGSQYFFEVNRYNTDGSLDVLFDADGKVTTDFAGNDDEAYAIAIQSDGKIVAAGTSWNGSDYDFALARYENCTPSSSAFSVTGCYSYTVPSGDETYFANGVYMDTIPNAIGCDSVMTITVTLLNTTSTISPIVCDSYTVPSGDETYTVDGTYMDTIPNFAGCDSIITINLNIISSNGSSITVNNCGPYVWNSVTYPSSGTFTDTLTNMAGCDSVLTLYLTVSTLDLTITSDAGTLSAPLSGVWFQWLDCNNSFAELPGEYNRDFTPTADGDYAVIITTLACSDTSACVSLDGVGLSSNTFGTVTTYPNPTNGLVTIAFTKQVSNVSMKVMTLSGQVVLQTQNLNGSSFAVDMTQFSNGVYFIELNDGNAVERVKIIRE